MTQFGFAQMIGTIEAALVDVLGLEPIELPAGLFRASGSIRRSPVELTARAYTGRHARLARVVTLTGGPIEVTDLLVVPRETSGAPILAIELESDDHERGYVIADLVSMVDDEATNAAQLRELANRRPAMMTSDALVGLMPLGELPSWRRAWASPRPMHAQVELDDTSSVTRAAAAYAGAFTALARDGELRPARDVLDRHSAYLRDRRDRDPVIGLIARGFGYEFASQLVERVLFPRLLPT
ncbi:MAG: hypothetical protein H0T42_04655 [Deltaproteobacteria bacterium]|nr:hypothetical protein [Deltaproteobacteria bacterium]